MLKGTVRDPQEIVGAIPPNNALCTVEKIAINAVMAGCKPEYMPVVLAAVEAALEPGFAMHGLLCTTYFSSPMVVVNGSRRPPHRHEFRGERARARAIGPMRASAARCSS